MPPHAAGFTAAHNCLHLLAAARNQLHAAARSRCAATCPEGEVHHPEVYLRRRYIMQIASAWSIRDGSKAQHDCQVLGSWAAQELQERPMHLPPDTIPEAVAAAIWFLKC